MGCKDCNWYNSEKRMCVKAETFQFPNMPICTDFKENTDEKVTV